MAAAARPPDPRPRPVAAGRGDNGAMAHPDDPLSRTDDVLPLRSRARDAGLRSMRQLVQLRWIAVCGQVVTILFVHFGLSIALPLEAMAVVLALLVAFNLGAVAWCRWRPVVGTRALFVSLLVDVLALTLQLHLSGGIGNPFVLIYLLQVVLAAVLLRPFASWLVAALACVGVFMLALVPGPVSLQADPASGIANPYVGGLLISLVMVATLLVVFVGRIGRIVRDRDASLAALRQRAAEETHVVRMGLLASGAAHELGTPLSTLAVILGDWRHLPHFESDPELLQDVVEMQEQVLRCKAIVTGILASAGSSRAEDATPTTLRTFLDEVAADWRTRLPDGGFTFRNAIAPDLPIVADTALRQMLFNVLDNAREASPASVRLRAERDEEALLVEIADDGPGFPPDILAHLGEPYRSGKGDRPGRGLGLFLSYNVARTLGGRIGARNVAGGGAVVTLRLPLDALSVDDADLDAIDVSGDDAMGAGVTGRGMPGHRKGALG